MTVNNAPCEINVSRKENALEAAIVGDWVLDAEIPDLEAVLAQLGEGTDIKRLVFSTKALGRWDSLLMTELIRLIDYGAKQGIQVDTSTLPEGIQGLLSLVYAVPERVGARRQEIRTPWLEVIGQGGLRIYKDSQALVVFIGETALSVAALMRGKARFRWVDLWTYIQDCGPSALPIVTLISLLVGLILAFVGAVQLALFGAQIYIADLVGLGMTREMGGLMTAIIMSGRTGAAYAAQLGTMQVNSEIDALKTMGFEPMEFLVLPRILALILIMPLLCLYADLMGIVGGALVTVNFFDVSLVQYLDRTAAAIHMADFSIGIFKCAVFGVLIALSGCMRGMQCGRSASAVGDAATSAVVTGIVFIVIADSLMTVMCNRLGI
ncbi:MAG: ABC transporter permease [Methylococcaceae bacterium]|jgi:phospholipid/cholesterol/gamma-HCH transport system permease protein|nr:ABC transporter permease [Methylococcaceae bacterium]MDD1636938.1 ABC transporter permease [Methylococcaceae bacterium]MDD1643942.1 ABC transporter permease [Methylococcaceae bacterium]